ncbi:hypothetical protein KR215_008182 [Drosophila sulfurigaster]|uniref:Uncharacterized protein LOC127565562 n=1 Tax=Drosophila albomicans TaxID=7291 RepID=A0A9C6SX68_DROAB|nr:uncharacterized protein LOC127565562 [Drosophila albomicans]XP_060656499.1 uncharacterized protein LOC132791552 [Drosophila nasuta]XP_062129259.1 uncharacterized protein LOC133841022 [Drosophila sulfurigaster albostrigata]KAH8404030.1 hypothetical protein KR215_008182 [Drosophila sulfurigaster]
MSEYKRAFNFVVRAIAAVSLLIVMAAFHQQDDDAGSHYIHPRRVMQ